MAQAAKGLALISHARPRCEEIAFAGSSAARAMTPSLSATPERSSRSSPTNGTDTLQTTLTNYSLPANVENLTYIGTGDVTWTATVANEILYGRGGQ